MSTTEGAVAASTTRSRRWWRSLGVLVVVALAGGGGILAGQAAEGDRSPGADRPDVPTATAAVTRRTLADRTTVDGTLGFAGATRLPNHAAGMLTWTPPVGKVAKPGQTLYRLDDRPVVLLDGRLPQWREFRLGMSKGSDIRQLEANLRALGFDPHQRMTIDDTFTSTTAAAVRRWQVSLGRDRTGVVGLGDVVFHRGPVRVAERLVPVGSKVGPGAGVLQVTSTRQVVTVRLDAARRTAVKVGTKVRVVLPSRRTIDGTVTAVGRVATKRGDDVTVDVQVELPRKGAGRGLDHAPVEVLISLRSTTTLAVPIKALVALPTGGFAVEVVTAGQRRLVPVKTGMSADGYMAVSGAGITEGTEVVVPR